MEGTLRRVANIQHGERRALCAEVSRSPLPFFGRIRSTMRLIATVLRRKKGSTMRLIVTVLRRKEGLYAPHCHCSQHGGRALCASLSLFSAWQGGMYTGSMAGYTTGVHRVGIPGLYFSVYIRWCIPGCICLPLCLPGTMVGVSSLYASRVPW